ncbi:MAG: nitroreductase family protein [Deltaproteobacteria bacterium]|nr:nitroreductase family protein [Deltaproteobacteria bacterium]
MDEHERAGGVRVDASSCTGCGACVDVCPMRLLELESGAPTLRAGEETLCIACGHCVAVCPTAAFDHAHMTATACPPLRPELTFGEEAAEQFLRSRRSIRRYVDRPVEPSRIARLLRLATYAPSGRNAQPVHWLVVSGHDAVAELAEGVLNWMRRLRSEQPSLFEAWGMERVLRAAGRGEDPILRRAPHLIVAHAPRDSRPAPAAAVTALAYLELAAPSLGLGTCWAGYFTSAAVNFPPLQEKLALPEGHVTYGAAMLGYPAVRYARLPLRREPPTEWRG